MSKPQKVYRWSPVLDAAGNPVKDEDGSDKYERGTWTGQWRVQWKGADGKRRSETFATEAAARAAVRRREVDADDIRAGLKQAPIVAPLFADFVKEFTSTYVAANNKHSERVSKEKSYRLFLLPAFGGKRLDEITLREVEKLKADMLAENYARKSVNNVLITLGRTLRYAKELGVLAIVPTVKLMKTPPPEFDFLSFEELERLVVAAEKEPDLLAAILAAAEAGLRSGELRALRFLEDVDFHAGKLTVRRSEYRGGIDSPKGGRARTIPMTRRLTTALKATRHLKGELVFCDADGALLTEKTMTYSLQRLCKRAGLRKLGWHSLRHTFCSHLAMRGAAARAIQELAGHANLATTQRYMHLSPNSTREAIALLEGGALPVHSAPATQSS